ncbi:DUF84 family protein [Metabacillus malikii]|uniref:Probable inosine/xanthosine triphosphatase n=1 Tax=Metabacillus malikii TaxID=1504265 RepID=A0ABT9ZMW0_9BACI|nr:DUF84 family protein [Metabacillus malikii]MDQ0233594.1 inosine/xanthosine triphosphatase [Metabacillus malikii]
MIIAIGTKNPTKVNAIKTAFAPHLSAEFAALQVQSNVSPQPLSDEETVTGAINRAKNALNEATAQLGVGLEGGVIKSELGYFLCNWGAMVDNELKPIVAGGARIVLPNEIGDEVFSGRELGDVMDEYVKSHQVGKHQGAIGIFTNGIINRTTMFTHLAELLIGQYLYQNKQEK